MATRPRCLGARCLGTEVVSRSLHRYAACHMADPGHSRREIASKRVGRSTRLMDGPYRLLELDVGHWLIQEAEADVLRETLAHIEAFGA